MLTASLALVFLAMGAVAFTALPLVRKRYHLKPLQQGTALLIPLWQIAMMAISALCGITFGHGVPSAITCEVLIAVIGFACAAFNPRLFAGIERAAECDYAAARTAALEEQVDAQRSHLRQAERAAADVECARRTYAEGFELIAQALETDDSEQVRAALERIDALIPHSGGRLCRHPVADALLKAKMAEAQRVGVHLEVHADLPLDLELTDSELCAVLANLVDNAVAAAQDDNRPEKEVSTDGVAPCVEVTLGVRQGYFVVQVVNPVSSQQAAEALARAETSRAATLSRDVAESLPEHGWGLGIVREIAERRSGSLETELAHGRFHARAVLRLG